MVDSIAAASLLGYLPINGCYYSKDVSIKRSPADPYRQPFTKFPCRKVPFCVSPSSMIKAQAKELTKEAYPYSFRDEERTRTTRDFRNRIDTGVYLRPGMWPPENKADNPALNNPLLRQERMGCGWLGVIFEWEGVLVEDNPDLEKQAWLTLSQEEGKSPPPAFLLRRIEGMKNEQAMSEVLCWSRDPSELKRMASRKEDIHQALHGGMYSHSFRPGSRELVNVLMHQKVPMALVSTRPRKSLEQAIGAIDMEGVFDIIVAAEDVHRGKPDPEMFVYAAQLLQFIPERCIVFGNSNQTVEAAHDAQMKCVAVASKHPVYELNAADLVVRHLNELSVVDLKNLADIESPEFGHNEPELEMEPEAEDEQYHSSTGFSDDFW
ncbi:5-amino-6-(5-phospho-D-ribitylamino)uracil phosphatase, chloroplastic-like [Andrographis paniculata]|uniref:5-amino-6-(5-phospho-D-ribitylamino)uracil phosphatase, chloroplastic-like n=1 Tax=Andrographis paniculata TaxID=175694 RepID=UPI0021E864D9|nr:5-amino-6-(5-phospho-D-ribitylamino)uracil phosphatase, chloroplastic-like [Andrographis paniculata]